MSAGRPLHDYGAGCVLAFPGRKQARRNLSQMMHPHQDHQRAGKPRQRFKIQTQPRLPDRLILLPRILFLPVFPGRRSRHHRKRCRKSSVRDRNACCCRHRNSRRNTRNLFTGNARRLQRLKLFPASAEHIRVAALQAHHRLTFQRLLHQQVIDLRLLHDMTAITLPHIDLLAVRPRPPQQRFRRQTVIDHRIAPAQYFRRLDGQKFYVAAPAACQIYFSVALIQDIFSSIPKRHKSDSFPSTLTLFLQLSGRLLRQPPAFLQARAADMSHMVPGVHGIQNQSVLLLSAPGRRCLAAVCGQLP